MLGSKAEYSINDSYVLVARTVIRFSYAHALFLWLLCNFTNILMSENGTIRLHLQF